MQEETVDAIKSFYRRREARLRQRLTETEDLMEKYWLLKIIHKNRKLEIQFLLSPLDIGGKSTTIKLPIRSDADFNEADHPRDENGQFASSGAGSSSGPSTGAEPQPLSAEGENTPCTGFASKAKLKDHTKRHGLGVGASTETEYQQKGIDFLKQPCGGDVVGYSTSDGKVVRFNKVTTEYASGIPGGALKTFMKVKCKKDGSLDPEGASAYYERVKERDGG